MDLLVCITFVHYKTALLIHERQKPALFFILPLAPIVSGILLQEGPHGFPRWSAIYLS
jgi:hypothetical protein